MNNDPIIVKVGSEANQAHESRQKLYESLETHFDGKCVLSYFTSSSQPVIMDDTDVDMIENILQKCDLSKGLVMVIHSLGGDGLAAERIINICRAYSNGGFEVVVPKMAKSAATMVALGANKIWMSMTAELGPIDPQVIVGNSPISVHSIVTSYEELLRDASQTQGNLEPYLQQLQRYDARQIQSLKSAQDLADNIAITALRSGMMKGTSEDDIKQKLKPFTDPTVTSSHGRPIQMQAALDCGLTVEDIPLRSELWPVVWELYVRLSWVLDRGQTCAKIVETKEHSFAAS